MVMCLQCKHVDLGRGPQHPYKSDGHLSVTPSLAEAETGGHRGWMAGSSVQKGHLRVSVGDPVSKSKMESNVSNR